MDLWEEVSITLQTGLKKQHRKECQQKKFPLAKIINMLGYEWVKDIFILLTFRSTN